MTARGDYIPGYDRHSGQMLVVCWCGCNFLWVPSIDVREGRGAVCARPECRTLAEAAA